MDKGKQVKGTAYEKKLDLVEWKEYMRQQAIQRALELNEREEKDGENGFKAMKYADTYDFCTANEKFRIQCCCEAAWAWGRRTKYIPPTYVSDLRRAIWLSTLS